jgi:hypothetical protein
MTVVSETVRNENNVEEKEKRIDVLHDILEIFT